MQRNETAASFSERCCLHNEKELTQNHDGKYGVERSACAASLHPSMSIVVHPLFANNYTEPAQCMMLPDRALWNLHAHARSDCDLHAATAHLHKCAVIRLSLPCIDVGTTCRCRSACDNLDKPSSGSLIELTSAQLDSRGCGGASSWPHYRSTACALATSG